MENRQYYQEQLHQKLTLTREKLINCLSELREIEHSLIPTLKVSNEYDQLINDKTDLLINFAKSTIDLMDQVAVTSKTNHDHDGNNVMITKLQHGEYNIMEKDLMNDQRNLLIKLVTNFDNSTNHQNGYPNGGSSSLPSQDKPSPHLNHNGSIPLSSFDSNEQGNS